MFVIVIKQNTYWVVKGLYFLLNVEATRTSDEFCKKKYLFNSFVGKYFEHQ